MFLLPSNRFIHTTKNLFHLIPSCRHQALAPALRTEHLATTSCTWSTVPHPRTPSNLLLLPPPTSQNSRLKTNLFLVNTFRTISKLHKLMNAFRMFTWAPTSKLKRPSIHQATSLWMDIRIIRKTLILLFKISIIKMVKADRLWTILPSTTMEERWTTTKPICISHLSPPATDQPTTRSKSSPWSPNKMGAWDLFTTSNSQLKSSKLLKLKSQSKLTRKNLNSQMVDGNATNARTTTSREERLASDARKSSALRTTRESQNTCSRQQPRHSTLNKRKSVPMTICKKKTHAVEMRTAPLISTSKLSLPQPPLSREWVTGLASDVTTTTLALEKYVTCATWTTSSLTACFTSSNNHDTWAARTWTNTSSNLWPLHLFHSNEYK